MRSLVQFRPCARRLRLFGAVLAVASTVLAGVVVLAPRPASAATTVLRPNGDVVNGWQTKPGGTAWDALNDDVLDPAPAPATDWIWAGASGRVAEVGMSTTAIDERAIHHGSLLFYANTGSTTQLKVEVIWSGAVRGSLTVTAGQGFGWRSISIAPGRQSAVDDLRLRFTSVGGGDANVRAAYVTVNAVLPTNTLDWENTGQRTLPGATPPGAAPPGWKAQLCCSHSATNVSSPTRAGQWASRFELNERDLLSPVGSRRAELTRPNPDVDEVERWYAFSIYLPGDTWRADKSPEILAQWHQQSNYGSPPLSLGTRNGTWEIAQHWGPVDNQVRTITPLSGYATDRWTDWVVHVRWSAGTAGLVEFWQDGRQVCEFWQDGRQVCHVEGRNKDADGYGVYTKFGVYKWDWADDDPDDSDTSKRVVFHDEYRSTEPSS